MRIYKNAFEFTKIFLLTYITYLRDLFITIELLIAIESVLLNQDIICLKSDIS